MYEPELVQLSERQFMCMCTYLTRHVNKLNEGEMPIVCRAIALKDIAKYSYIHAIQYIQPSKFGELM